MYSMGSTLDHTCWVKVNISSLPNNHNKFLLPTRPFHYPSAWMYSLHTARVTFKNMIGHASLCSKSPNDFKTLLKGLNLYYTSNDLHYHSLSCFLCLSHTSLFSVPRMYQTQYSLSLLLVTVLYARSSFPIDNLMAVFPASLKFCSVPLQERLSLMKIVPSSPISYSSDFEIRIVYSCVFTFWLFPLQSMCPNNSGRFRHCCTPGIEVLGTL